MTKRRKPQPVRRLLDWLFPLRRLIHALHDPKQWALDIDRLVWQKDADAIRIQLVPHYLGWVGIRLEIGGCPVPLRVIARLRIHRLTRRVLLAKMNDFLARP